MGCAQSKERAQEGRVRDAAAPTGTSPPQQCTADQPAAPARKAGQASVCQAVAVSRESPTSTLLAPEDVCYKPETEKARLQALVECKCLDTTDERRFDSITNLLKGMFQVPMALVSLIDDDRLVFKSVAGTDCRQGNRLHSFCDASLRAPNPTMMVVPDTLEDPRFRHSQFVQGAPHVRMYAGAPLVSSEGHILGSLGVMDVQPRSFPAGALNMICNFAELVVRELERDMARQREQQGKLQTALSARRHMVRALSCFQEAVMLCNVAEEGWSFLYVNDNWCTTTGFSEPACLNSTFWDLFHPPLGAPGCKQAAVQAAKERAPFAVTVAGGHCSSATLDFKPATSDHLSLAVPTIGIPNFVEGLDPPELKALDGMFFAVVRESRQAGSVPSEPSEPSGPSSGSADLKERRPRSDDRSSVDSLGGGAGGTPTGAGSRLSSLVTCDMRSVFSYTRGPFGLTPPESMGDLKLGPLLGKGAYGKVYRGQWKGATVAVKILDSWVDPGSAHPTRPMLEALLSKNLLHPNIVQTFDFAVQIFEDSGSDSSQELGSPGSDTLPALKHQQVWIVQQYCNHGTLGDAVDRGWLRAQRARDGPPNFWAILPTMQEIAAAVQYLHSQGVIHGDITPGNVLLAGARHMRRRDPRSFQAKVGDFGLSALSDGARRESGATLGTMSHMPIELIEREVQTTAVDAYSYGVLCWEMLAGKRAYAGFSPIQVLSARTTQGEELVVPPGCPEELKALVEACLSADHTRRPSFNLIVATLDRLIEEDDTRASGAVSPGAVASA